MLNYDRFSFAILRHISQSIGFDFKISSCVLTSNLSKNKTRFKQSHLALGTINASKSSKWAAAPLVG